jgi:diguanylate cyclase (GGDEF)-like protein
LVGTLCVIDTRPRTLDEGDLASLRDLAGMVEEQLGQARDATLDGLTGLLNRRGVRLVGEYLVSTARRQPADVVVLMLDLDAFKAINDSHGHAVGDAALIQFANALRGAFRSGDVVCRLAGDEFCVIARARIVDTATMLARLDAALDLVNAQAAYRLGYSVGIAALDPARHVTFDDWLASADAGMYDHKRRVR